MHKFNPTFAVGTMLHFEDMLFVCSPLLAFMSFVARIGGGCTIRWYVGVEDSDICFCLRILGLDVEHCALLSIGASEGESPVNGWRVGSTQTFVTLRGYV